MSPNLRKPTESTKGTEKLRLAKMGMFSEEMVEERKSKEWLI